MRNRGALWFLCLVLGTLGYVGGEVLNPPYFNLAEQRKITASSTCGEGVDEPELYCKLVGANTDFADNPNINLIYGQVCDYCDPSDPRRAHPPEHAIDGSNNRWQSPPLSRGMSYNEVNLTIDLGQEFHVAYVFIKMGNSPRPGVWVLERSKDNGQSYMPWQYFADTPGDCVQNFGPDSLQPLLSDDTVICETKFSKVVPLEQGEIVVSLLNGRPNADNFSYSPVLQEFTKATNIRLRFLRTKTLLGHLMSVARQDPTVTRRYFYSIKDINIGGRCVCNGHAETCDLTDPKDPYKLLCRCQHNTCGSQCETCCPDYQQKKWRRAILDSPFICEPCNCYEHSDECAYDEKVDQERGSLDIHGHYEGGGVCKNCRHNTEGINCNRCKPTFFRPYGKLLNATDVCQPCNCDLTISTGNCATGNGQCECRPEYLPPYCDNCNVGYYGYPEFCKPCDCHPDGTTVPICEVGGGQCPCKPNFGGLNCDTCKEGFFGFPSCTPCNCNPSTSIKGTCAQDDGQCSCQSNYGGRQCDRCNYGFYDYPRCDYCSCDPTGCIAQICDALTGVCLCKPGYGGPSCDRCAPGYSGYPVCEECNCNEHGSVNSICDINGRCHCLQSFSGRKCDQCSPGHYDFPNCQPCNCEQFGSVGLSCNDAGHCFCKDNFDGEKCDHCKENFYNYPYCEECNCNPAGVLPTFLGCGSLTSGKLCECKEHVTGRICNECKPLYYNLKISNPLGCEDCNCFPGGTVGGLAVCSNTNGQCMCKPNVGSRDCSECVDGTYQLESGDLFGCKDCECDIGGSVNNICDRQTGQCSCRPRIAGRNCDAPLHTHYFPTLFQHKFEIEDGRTPVGTQVRYSYDDNVFPGFSWRGYAVFSNLQKEVLLDILIEKPSLYQVFFYYLNFGGENVYGIITFTPETFGDIQQSSDIIFDSTTRPLFMKVSGKQGLVASPFVLNPGRWTVSIRVEKPLFIDYMVLLPQSYYEATLLQEDISTPCSLSGAMEEMCLLYRYPPFPANTEVVRGDAGYNIPYEDERDETNVFDDGVVLLILDTEQMALLNKDQENLHLDFTVSRPGPHVMIVTYHTPRPNHPVTATVEVSSENQVETGSTTFYDCNYSFLCRDFVVNEEGKVAVFNADTNHISVILHINADEETAIAIDNVALVPEDLYKMDFVVPKPLCIRHEGTCKQSEYLPIPESTKVEFEAGYNEYGASVHPNGIIDTDLAVVSLQDHDNVINLHGSVPNPGLYAFIVHYYQPDHPTFDTKVIIQNAEVSNEAKLKFPFCPSVSGCRTVVHSKDTNEMSFQIQKDFHLNIRQPLNQTVRIAYVLAIPAKEFHENLLSPLPEDKAGKFIKECGKNSFLLNSDVNGFCREAVFSLTAEYNNGALPCQCDTDGSLSYECEEFGGACQCKSNVIGRTCSQCRTGFFGFPNCKPCDCPSTAYCQPITGQCICPPRVTGDRCDRCVPYTYGFDSIIGCEDCSCNHLGVVNSNVQCDLQTGQCQCKTNIVGRTCEKCKQGYWAFPHCQLCNCDLRGTTADICEAESARCHCKDNVYGDSCDQCKPGTFYLEEVNPLGCSKCFCFGTTDRCSSGYLFKTQILAMSDWGKKVIDVNNDMANLDVEVLLYENEDAVQAVLPPELPDGSIFYYEAPSPYLGNKLSSYGGNITYTVFTSIGQNSDVESSVGPDLILMGNNLTIVHDHIEQPAGGIPFNVFINLLEHEFHHVSEQEVTREQMMMVLVNLDRLLIRGSYFQPVEEIRLKSVLMDTADENYVAGAPQALRIEQCQCPPSYRGHSCESCAPGYYRSRGPHLGYCVPCQCNGHAQTCDVNTGECIDCKHNTVGKHCEQCAPGYHGDSTQGTPYDCLICACPLPIESNNFAESCEVSPSGQEISCLCKPGYFGERCEVCSIGFYGSPEIVGSKCNPCECSGNIDSSQPGACDSVTGDCILCLNNTFGIACELCAPGFHGDAIAKKDCEKCDCDTCGTRDCDHETGECICHQNVEGTQCDRCHENHWGFNTCAGCRPCNCGPASRSEACDGETGQCPCQPGAAGLTCDICEPGFWQYSTDGCVSCNCDEKYSAGAVCNPVSGICTCLPGVLGDKCDKCPYRWVFLKNQGCFECDTCVHGLVDVTDELYEIITPAMEEIKDASLSYFANKRLQNVNQTANTLRLGIDELLLDPTGLDYSPLVAEVQSIEKLKDVLDRSAVHLHTQAEKIDSNADDTRVDALEVESIIGNTIGKVRDIIDGLSKLSEGLESSLGPNVDNLIVEAEDILAMLKLRNFEDSQNATVDEYSACEDLLDHVKSFELPVIANKGKFVKESEKLTYLGTLLDELSENSKKAHGVADDAQVLHEELQAIPVKDVINDLEQNSDSLYEVLKEASDLLDKTKTSTEGAQKSFKDLASKAERLLLSIRDLKDEIKDTEEGFKDLKEPIREATAHANFLMDQAALLDSLLADTRDSSDAAVKAAKAYENIEEAINDAYEAAQSALEGANMAGSMSGGVLDKTSASKDNTSRLLEVSLELENQVTVLEPQLQSAKDGVLLLAHQNTKTIKGIDSIKDDLDKLPLQSLGVLAGIAAEDSASADRIAGRARERIEDIVTKLPDDQIRSKEVPKEIEDTRQAIKAAHSYADRVASIVPDTNKLIDKASKKESVVRIIGKDFSEKIAKLRQKVAIARTQSSRIKLGVKFIENTTLQLRNPELQKAATYTYMSMYFKTSERFGLLAFVGNEKGAHNKMKRVLTDDYMALEVRGGRLVLIMDIGSGSQEIKHDTYVSDGEFHQVIIERTGKTCTITVKGKDVEDSVVEGYLPGTYSVFNLDPKISKFFIGGINENLMLPDTLSNYHFDGCIEDVIFGETPVGLWNFVSAENNIEGCAEQDAVKTLPSNGLRFSGLSSYVILPRNKRNFSSETHIKMNFKTYAKDGLLFLIGKNKDFFALEMEDGRIVLKYDLGSGSTSLKSSDRFNDGKWHSLEATRDRNEGILIVNQVEVDSGIAPGSESTLSVTNQIFVGGYTRRQHSYPGVTHTAFEGCIVDMVIGAEFIDLNKNKEALGVANGCPATIARTVSFSNSSGGYIAMQPVNLEKLAQLTFKFKTEGENGLIFYSSNDDQSNFLYIGLENGGIVMKSQPGGEIKTRDVKFNDREWHYVSATKAVKQMRLDIDDFSSVEVTLPVDALVSDTNNMYFAGVPEDFTISADVRSRREVSESGHYPFVGCLGDFTVNNKFQNFADSQDKKSASLASCPLADPHAETIPVAPDEPSVPEFESSTAAGVDEDFYTDYPDGPDPTPVGQCLLPLQPRRDTSVKPGDGVRFGNSPFSRQEFTKPSPFMNSILDKSTFALEFKSSLNNGLIFYVSDSNHIDFVGLIMQSGKIVYVFNCGSGTATITSQNTYNDGEWHRVVFAREGKEGRLAVDDEEVVLGTSNGSARSVNVKAPFYLGGLTEEVKREAKNNLKGISYSFPGCIRNVEVQGELLTRERPTLKVNTTGCSSKVEEGTFFSSDGGYLVLYDKYRVKDSVTITMDIKPRNLSGILMAVHGKKDYFILQLVDGNVVCSVDNGAGAIKAFHYPSDKHSLCDGQFHTIQVFKSKNVLTLSVDGAFSKPGIGVGGVSSTDTNDPLYIGGLPESSLLKKGVETFDQFVGCMRYLELNSKPQSLAESKVFGHVTLNTCPTI